MRIATRWKSIVILLKMKIVIPLKTTSYRFRKQKA